MTHEMFMLPLDIVFYLCSLGFSKLYLPERGLLNLGV